MIGNILGAIGQQWGDRLSGKGQKSMHNKQLKWWLASQQRAVQWRVEDAKKSRN